MSVSNSDIYLNKYPIYQTAGTTTITYSIIRNNADYGIYAYVNGGYIPTSVAVYGTQFGGNALADTYMSGNVHFENENNAPYQSLPVRGFQIAGTSYSDEVWNPGIPYVISGLGVSANHSLTIQPGTIVKFMTRASIGVNGTLAAIGSQAKKIYFTSLNDDSVGGDTNGTSTQPTSTDYLGLNFSSGSRGTISNAVLRYGGYYNIGTLSVGALRNLGGVVQIDRSRFTNNYYGIYQTSGTTTVAQSSIADNTMYGIYNQYQNPYAPSLSAIGNWWGSATGPFHPTANPNGTGNRVSDRVQFAPWLSSDPTAMGEPGEQCIPGGC